MPNAISFKTEALYGDASLPVIPYTLDGAPTARARFLATTGAGAGSTITSWSSLDGATTMTPVNGTAPTRATQDGYTVARFNGVDNHLRTDLVQSRPHSLAITFYVHAIPSSGTTHAIVGGQVNTSSDPAVGDSGMLLMGGPDWNIHAGTNGNWGPASLGWHTAVISFDATNTVGRIDNIVTTRNVGQVPRKILTLGGHRGAYYANISVAEVVTWDQPLATDQMMSIEASMRAHYGI